MIMKQNKRNILLFLISISLISCDHSQEHANSLKGDWQIMHYNTDISIVQPDSVPQFFSFHACSDAYTATCKVWFKYLDQNPATPDSAQLNFTLKDDELAFIDSYINIPNFTKIFKQQRFFIRKLNQEELRLERFSDSLLIQATRM